jgi:purine-cytosine permease-like protein
MLSDIGSAIVGDLARERFRTIKSIVFASFLAGALFFLLTLLQELLFSSRPLLAKDVLVLAGLGLLVGAFMSLILLYARWRNTYRSKESSQ